MSNPDFDYWRAALAGERPRLRVGEVHCGFYRIRAEDARTADRPFIPVAIWRGNKSVIAGRLVRKIGDSPAELVTEEWAETGFPLVSLNPVTGDAYWQAVNTGVWPDDPPPMLSNNPPPDVTDEFTALTVEIDTEKIAVADWLRGREITTQEEADRATNWIARIAELDRRRDRLFQAEKRPLREAAAAVDNRFRSLAQALQLLKTRLKAAQTDFLRAEDARRRAEQDQLRAKAEDGGKVPPRSTELPVPRARSGTHGRKVSLVEKRTGRITDRTAFTSALSSTYPVVFDDFLQEQADRHARADKPLPGMEIVREMVPR